MSADARVHPRFSVSGRADVIGEEIVLAREIADLSLGGCRFHGPAWESAGTAVHMVVSFASLGSHLPVNGVVVRASERDMGVKFTDLSDEQKWALRKHIRELQSEMPAGRG